MRTWSAICGVFLLGGALAGCVNTDSPIRLMERTELTTAGDGTCTATSGYSKQVSGGSLDVAQGIFAAGAGMRARLGYLAAYGVESQLVQSEDTVNTTSANTANKNAYVGTEQVFSYSTAKSELTIPQAIKPLHFVIQPGAKADNSYLILNLISADASDALVNFFQSQPADKVLDLRVTIQLRGHLLSGQNINTNEVAETISIYNSGFTGCAAGVFRAMNGPCGTLGGQDGSGARCCTGTPLPDGCE